MLHVGRARLWAAVTLASLAVAPAAPAQSDYLPPVEVSGHVFPVARTGWFSVINFTHDWQAPRFRRVNGKWRLVGRHEGNDIFAEPGTPVFSMVPGTVERIGWLFYSGWRVGIRGDDGRYWFYAHLKRYAPGLAIGRRVQAGDLLGEVGNTGYGNAPGHDGEFAPHLHLGIQEPDGRWVDPYPLLKETYERTTRN
ncbi:MAG: M23 family metallopeptidase [Actinomycetota bacterium]